MRATAPAPRVADAIVFVAFLAVPLAVTPALWDEFVTSKWYVLEALVACWLLAEAWAGSAGWPRFLRDNAVLALLLAGLGLASAFRSGAAAALAPLVERSAVLALALCAFWSLRRGGRLLEAARAATALALPVVTAIGLAQAAGHDPLATLRAGDHRGSTFGNANMAAQYAGLSVLLLVSVSRPRRRWRGVAEWVVVAATAVWLVLLATRSVLLALGAGLLALWLAARPATRGRQAAAALLCAALVALVWWGATRLLEPDARAHKAVSLEDRVDVWSDTLRLIRDHPLGLGAGNYEDAFRAYQATGSTFVDEDKMYRQPHNEYLRIAAEEGLPFLALLAVLLVRLGGAVSRSWRAGASTARPLTLGWTAFLLVEAFFQFPFALPFSALATAVLLGMALWQAEGPPPVESRRPALWRAAAVMAAAFILFGAGRLALSERLFVAARGDLGAQERACRLDPRNLPACVMAAWLRGGAGDVAGGRALLVQVLRRAPHYPPAVKLLAQQALAAGERDAACTYMWTYDALFRGQSTLHGELMASCDEAARRAASQRVPTPHYERFPLSGSDRQGR